jgi:Cellulose binding domain
MPVPRPAYANPPTPTASILLPPVPPDDPARARPRPPARGERRLVVAVSAVGVIAIAMAGFAGYAVAPHRPDGPMRLPLPPGLVENTTPQQLPTFPATAPASQPNRVTAGPTGTPTAALTASASPSAQPSATPATSESPTETPSVTPSPQPTEGSPSPVGTGPASLSAGLTISGTGPLGATGYSGQVVITNTGGTAAQTWTVVLSLPDNETVIGASGAVYQQSGVYVTFTPQPGTAVVDPGQSVTFTFDVDGLLAEPPNGCAIDGHQC